MLPPYNSYWNKVFLFMEKQSSYSILIMIKL
jgi:hypothetical protein